MPMMMDDELDELFGDAPQLQLPSPVPKGLLQAVDDLRLSGCCQKIAWSRNGCIAYITKDGRAVNLRHLQCSRKDGQWSLEEEHLEEGISTVHSDHRIVHLSWNHTANELAIVDIFGQISIYVVLIPINRIHCARRCVVDPEDNLSAVVGLTWLNTDRMLHLYRPAVKKAGLWNFASSPHKLMGPQNPNQMQKSALLAVTRGGIIRLFVRGQDVPWSDTRTEIDSISSSSGLLSHAAMSADKDSTMLLATHSVDKQLRLYRVSIDFQQLQIIVKHLKTINTCSPQGFESHGPLMNRSVACQLSHLELVGPGPETRNRENTAPFVLAVFSYVPHQDQDSSIREEPFSFFSRWELRSAKPKLHPSFEQLTSKKPGVSSSEELALEISLRRLDDVFVDRLLLSLQTLFLGTVLAMTYSDGTIEFRDRTSIEPLPTDERTRQVSGLFQVGFDFLDVGACLHTALSPNACAVVSLGDTQDVKLGLMQLSSRGVEGAIDNVILEAAMEAFVLHFATSCTSFGSYNEDLLAVIQLFSQQHSRDWAEQGVFERSLEEYFLNESYRVLQVNLDHAVEPQPDYLFKDPNVQRCLSMQVCLGFSGETQHRSLATKVAWTILNLRFTFVLLAYALKRPNPGSESEVKKPDVLRSFLGLVSWSMSLISFIIDDLFELANLVKHRSGADEAFLESKIREMNSPALSLVLVSSSRSFLRLNCRYLRRLSAESKASPSYGAQLQVVRELDDILEDSQVTLTQFERVLAELDSVIKNAYVTSQLSEADRKKMEKEMLVSGAVPRLLVATVETFLVASLDKLREEVDEAELYFTDISWLGLSDDGMSDAWKKKNVLDVMRKVKLPPETRLRRCTRCCAVMENRAVSVADDKWMNSFQRLCVCGGSWMVLGHEKADF